MLLAQDIFEYVIANKYFLFSFYLRYKFNEKKNEKSDFS